MLAGIVGTDNVPVGAHFFDDLGADSMLMARFCARVRKREDLPPVSMQDVYQHPTIRTLATALAPSTAAATSAEQSTTQTAYERAFAEVLKGIVGAVHVPADANFFDDLGADSMLMARFCARVRKREDLPPVSMQDVYQHPTIRSLTESLVPAPSRNGLAQAAVPAPPAAATAPSIRTEAPKQAGTLAYVLCGVVQMLFLLVLPALLVFVFVWGYTWISADPDLVHVFLRAVAFGTATFLVLCTVPILLKWVLIGRWKVQEIRVWSPAYLRFWMVKTLETVNPLALLIGSPLYSFYLRAMGAKVGRGVLILSKVPVCTDLVSIGDGAVVRKDAVLTGYRADDGVIRTGPVSIGKDAVVGESTVLDIGSAVGDGSQLGHSSSLQPGQRVPDGEHWSGSPAQPTDVDYRFVPTTDGSTWRRTLFATWQLASLLLIGGPLVYILADLALTKIPQLNALMGPGATALHSWTFYVAALALSTVLFLGGALLGLAFVSVVPRALNHLLTPGRVYPLYGFHYWVQRRITGSTNSKLYMRLFGGTSYVTHYLSWLGYDLHNTRQTGSNFGEGLKHDNPFLCEVGSGTMVADGLSMINTDYSRTSFMLSRVAIGAENFLGNRVFYSSHGRTGDNCLLATKLLVPLDGPVRTGVGLLGAPSFQIPRSVRRDQELDVDSPEELRRGLHAKNIHNTVSMALFLLTQWVFASVVLVLYLAALDLWADWGTIAFAVATVGIALLGIGWNLLLERFLLPLLAYAPHGCSIYDRAFWRHERFWKLANVNYINAFNGTPMKTLIWRLMGARIGRRVFDDGCFLTERTFSTIGDYCTLNSGSILQCHSQEDGGFKSEHTVIGAGCTLGVGAFVHYGVTMADGAVLATDSFLMKGEEVPPHAVWGGNPAKELRGQLGHVPAATSGIEGNRAERTTAVARERTPLATGPHPSN